MSFKNVLVQVHAENPSLAALETAKQIVAEGGKLTLVDVVPAASWLAKLRDDRVEQAIANAQETKQERLTSLAKDIGGSLQIEAQVLNGPTSLAIIRQVLAQDHDLVIRATKGALSRRAAFFGTTASRLLRKCPCPLLLMKPGHQWPFRRVAAAVDASQPDELHEKLNTSILNLATPFAAGDLHNLHVISAWTMYGESVLKDHMREGDFDDVMGNVKANSEHTLDDLLIKYGMGVGWDNVHLFHGDPQDVLTEYIRKKEIDLLVMGSVARAGLSGVLMGNTAEQILNKVECSVLVTKPAGFVSPVKL